MKNKTKFALKVTAAVALTATAVYCVYRLGKDQEVITPDEAETIADGAETVVTTIGDGIEAVGNFFRK
jgi:hypothetical protein